MAAGSQAVAQFQSHARIRRNIPDVGGFLAVFRNDPELIADKTIPSHRRPARLSRFAAGGFEDRAVLARLIRLQTQL